MHGIGKTVFSGSRVEDFQVEILGVLENAGPKQSLILARLSGGPLAETGVMAGMSGSPVYIDGRLAGAVAMAFAFSKEPIGAIRPIEDMLRENEPAPKQTAQIQLGKWDGQLTALLPPREDVLAGGARMADIATPVSFGGFTRDTIEHFAPSLAALGFEPRQGLSGGGRPGEIYGPPSALKPGSMISVQLLTGDMSVGADGTLTFIDGSKVYAFGHRLLGIGGTDLPFARADVIALLPNLNSSFKISAAREWMGTITEDRDTEISGRIGQRAVTTPVSVSVTRRVPAAGKPFHYEMQVVNDSILSPFLLQMAIFSAIDATERSLGDSAFHITGEVEFRDGVAHLKIDNMYSGNFNVSAQVALAVASPLAYALGSGFEALKLKRVALNIDSYPQKRELRIDQMWASRREVRPGESVDLMIVLGGDNGFETTHKVTYNVPVGAPLGPLQFTATDAMTANLSDYVQLLTQTPRSPSQVVEFLNGLHPNTRAYVRVTRAEPSFTGEGQVLPAAPPSLAIVMGRTQASPGGAPASGLSKLAEFEIGAENMVISGSKTIQVEVKE